MAKRVTRRLFLEIIGAGKLSESLGTQRQEFFEGSNPSLPNQLVVQWQDGALWMLTQEFDSLLADYRNAVKKALHR